MIMEVKKLMTDIILVFLLLLHQHGDAQESCPCPTDVNLQLVGSVTQTVSTTEMVQFTCTYSCHNDTLNFSPRWTIDIPPYHNENRYQCPPVCPNNVTVSEDECVNDTRRFSITFSEVTNDLNGTIVTGRLLDLLDQEQWYPINSFKLFVANKETKAETTSIPAGATGAANNQTDPEPQNAIQLCGAPIAVTAIISVTSVVILLTLLVICIMYKFELRPRICKSSVAPISDTLTPKRDTLTPRRDTLSEGGTVTDYDNSIARDDDKTLTPIQQLTGGGSTAVDTIDSKENVVEVHQC